ncbi:head GIN domain-containing protein [Flavobacteriaceae bacterium S356]|uniref:Head GIN domain-containing protein n=1 Tax=Asprobacillus argus TaxID=3076534 RepID=A0ABU3LGT0_9FLAO|nr:head GIN domain-containing protein [Flavobacteriaceae bacterium S356]
MKTTIKKLSVILFLSAFISSCGIDMFNRVDGNRNVVTKKRKIQDDFTKVKVSTGLDLYIKQGDKVSLTVEADENLHDIIITEVDNGRLKIYSEKNIWRAKARKVYLTVTDIEELKATSGSDAYSENTLKVKDFELSVSSGADANITIDADNITTSASSGADLRVSGKANTHYSSASSGSSINAFALKSRNVTVKVSSGADINIHASESINAKASSGGDIDYRGNPENVNKKTSSGGSVSKG